MFALTCLTSTLRPSIQMSLVAPMAIRIAAFSWIFEVSASGLEVNRPDAETSNIQENAAILIAIGATNDIWIDGRRVDVRQVKANITKLLADNPQGSVVIQADEKAQADAIIQVMDQSREAGVYAISLASEPKF